MPPGERVIVDGGYRSDTKVLSFDEYRRDKIKHIVKLIEKLRARHKTINACFKTWG